MEEALGWGGGGRLGVADPQQRKRRSSSDSGPGEDDEGLLGLVFHQMDTVTYFRVTHKKVWCARKDAHFARKKKKNHVDHVTMTRNADGARL